MDNCVFCGIANGKIPSYTVYEDDWFKVFLDISPAAPGHLLIISKRHANNIFELPEDIAKHLFPLAKKIAEQLKTTYNFDGLNILQNNGVVAGQSVGHFHMHLIPRYKNDDVRIEWKQMELNRSDFEKELVRFEKSQ